VAPSVLAGQASATAPRPSGVVEDLDGCDARAFLDPDVAIGERRDLRQVRDDDDLPARREPGQPPADRDAGPTADPLVHLVEHERRDVVEVDQDRAAREHRPRELSSRSDLRERQQRLPRAAREAQLDALSAGGSGLR
jgi:hypothetical protein